MTLSSDVDNDAYCVCTHDLRSVRIKNSDLCMSTGKQRRHMINRDDDWDFLPNYYIYFLSFNDMATLVLHKPSDKAFTHAKHSD